MKLTELKNKKILIIGKGLEGESAFRFFKQVFPEAVVSIVDQKDGADYLKNQLNFDLAIKSPGVPKDLLKIPYTTATNIFFANISGVTVGVTGSKGKSTTASLIYAILKEAGLAVHLVGNIGKPMLNELLEKRSNKDVYVCELSSYQLADIKYSPHISVITNLFPEHMDYHGNIENYYLAKTNILAYAGKEDYFIYNQNVERLAILAGSTKAKALPYEKELRFSEDKITLLGKHNVDNARAAVTVARLFNITDVIIEAAVAKFKSLPHRLEFVGEFKGVKFYDDAISTTPESTIQALLALPETATIFLGGLDRGYDFSELVELLVNKNISNIVLFPQSGKRIKDLLDIKNLKLKIFETSSMEDAVKFAYRVTPKGKICLLSTASPSYSIWKNFEEKGDLFQKFVQLLGKKNS